MAIVKKKYLAKGRRPPVSRADPTYPTSRPPFANTCPGSHNTPAVPVPRNRSRGVKRCSHPCEPHTEIVVRPTFVYIYFCVHSRRFIETYTFYGSERFTRRPKRQFRPRVALKIEKNGGKFSTTKITWKHVRPQEFSHLYWYFSQINRKDNIRAVLDF